MTKRFNGRVGRGSPLTRFCIGGRVTSSGDRVAPVGDQHQRGGRTHRDLLGGIELMRMTKKGQMTGSGQTAAE